MTFKRFGRFFLSLLLFSGLLHLGWNGYPFWVAQEAEAAHTTTFTFLSNAESWAFTSNNGICTGAFTGATGNPAGSLQMTGSKTGGGQSCATYWEWSGTWESLGVPAGHTVSGVSGSYDYAVSNDSSGSSWNTGAFELRNSAGTLRSTLVAALTGQTGTRAFTNRSGTTQTFTSEASNTAVRLRLNTSVSFAGGGRSWTGQNDNISLTITHVGPPTFEQSAYRLFNNLNSTNVGTPLALQDTAATLASPGIAFRLRMLLHVGTSTLSPSGQSFKLQYAVKSGTCDVGFVGETYADVTTSTPIAYYNNPLPSDGDTLTANANDPTHSGHTIINQTYEELNNFTNSSVLSIIPGQDAKWDFSLVDNGAPGGTSYCLRAVKSDNTLLDTYTVIPEVTTVQPLVVNISGNIYAAGSDVTLNTTPVSVALSINNGVPTILAGQTGSYSFTNVNLFEGDTVVVYVNGEIVDATTFTRVGAVSIADLHLYLDVFTIRSHNGSSITNANICAQSTYPGVGDRLVTCSAGVPTFSGKLRVGATYAPGGNVNVDTMRIPIGGTYSGASETLTLTGSGTGVNRPLYINSGTFTAPTLTRFTGGNSDIDATTFNNLEFILPGTITHTLGTGTGQTMTINGNLLIDHSTNDPTTVTANTYDPTITIGGNLTISDISTFQSSNSSTLSIGGNYTNNGTFSSNGGNVSFTSTANQTLAGSMTGTSAFGNVTFSGVGGAGTWATSFDTPQSYVYSFELDSTNNVLYAASGGASNGIIYRCDTSTGCDAAGDWTTSLSISGEDISSIIFDQTNGVLYAGATGGIIYRCATSTGCDATSDWTTSYATTQPFIRSFALDTTNGVLYAGGGAGLNFSIIYRCDTSTACDAAGDWTTSYSSSDHGMFSMIFDPTNSVLYAGNVSGRTYRCATSTGCDATGDWTLSRSSVYINYSFALDTTNGVLYAGSGGIIYRCDTSTGCDAAEDWTTSYATPQSNVYSLVFDSTKATLYAGTAGSGVIYRCATSTGCDAAEDWTTSYTPGGAQNIRSLGLDTTNGVLYAGSYSGGIIYRLALSTSKTFTANAETNNFTIASGNVTLPPGTLTVNGNLSDTGGVGTFAHNSGNVTLAGTTQQTIQTLSPFNTLTITNNSGTDPVTSPSVIFGTGINATTFTATTANTKLRFNAGSTYNLTNINLNGQAMGTRLALRSSVASTPWLLNVTGTQTVLNVDAKDSNASGGNTIVATDLSNVNSGGNTNWSFPQIVDVSGNIYDGGVLNTTPLDISISVNNGVPITLIDQTGSYSFTSVPAGPGDTLAVYVNGETTNATTFTQTDGAAITDLHLYLSTFTIRSHNASSITNANICAQSTYPGVGDTLVTCSATVPTFSDTLRLGATYAPGGNVNANAVHIPLGGTYSGASEILTLTGNGTGVSRPLYVDGGVFTAPLTVRHTGTLGTAIQTGVTYQSLEVLPVSGSPTYSLSGGNFISTDFTLGNGVNAVTLNATLGDDIFYNNVTISTNATYSSTDWTEITGNYTNNGTVDFGSATVAFNGTANQTLAGNMTGASAFGNILFSGVGGAGTWATSFNPQVGSLTATSMAFDSTNGVIYATVGRIIYRCVASTGCDATSDWTVSANYSTSTFLGGLTFDSTNGVLYAGEGTGALIVDTLVYTGRIFRCDTSTGCDAGTDWTTSYSPSGDDYVKSIVLDSTNGTLYAGTARLGIIYRCATSTGCDASGDWTVSYDTASLSISSFTLDSTNGVLYAGSGNGGIIYRCATSTGCDAAVDWTTSYDTPDREITSLTFDSTNGVLYAGTGNVGYIYRCATSTGCDASTDWTQSNSFSLTTVHSLVFNSTTNVIYAGVNGVIYSCATSTGCDASGDWTTSYDTLQASVNAFTLDSTNNVLYAGSGTNGIIYRIALSTSKTFTANAETNNFTISSGSVTFPSGTLTVNGNFTDTGGVGTFTHNGGNVILAGTSQQTIQTLSPFNTLTITNNSGTDPVTSPSVIFGTGINATTFTATTANTKLRFNAGSTYGLTNINLNGQAMGTPLTLRSSIASTPWLLSVTGTQTVLNVDVQDSNASGGNTINATNASNVNSGGNTNWDFPAGGAITFSISHSSVGFGALTAGAPRFCSADGNGSGSEIEAHTLSASTDFSGGYSITVRGATLTNEHSNTIEPIGGVSEASSVGTEQFGLRLNATGGSGVVSAPYGTTGEFAYGATASVSDEVASSPGISAQTVYSVRYLGNVAPTTSAGSYATNLTYVITSTF